MEIKNEKYETYIKTIESSSVDFVCIDPPYTDKKGNDVLKGHKIHTKINISHVVGEAFRVTKDNSLFAIFGQMPSIVDWHIEILNAGFEWKKDITWVKRMHSNPFLKPLRAKELIYIYKKGNAKFHKTNGKYEDIKIPQISTATISVESIKRYISELWRVIDGGDIKTKVSQKERKSNDGIYKKFTNGLNHQRFSEFTDVWSFSPENKSSYGMNGIKSKHPTVKPVKLIERLIELCTPEPTKENKPIVLDYFLGSGTTAIASVNTNREFKGCEMDKIYYETEIIPRVNKAIQNHNSDMFKSSEFGVLSCL